MSVTPASVKAAFQDAIPTDAMSSRAVWRTAQDNRSRGPVRPTVSFEVLLMAEDELRNESSLPRAREATHHLGLDEAEMVNVRKVFLDCFGTFDRMDKDHSRLVSRC